PGLGARPVARHGAHELVHGGRVVAPRGQPWEVADVDDRRGVVERAALGGTLEGDGGLGDTALVRGARRAEAGAGLHARVGWPAEPEAPRDPDRAQLLREALDPASREREVAVDPDVRAGRHLLAVEEPVDDDEDLLVLGARRVEQLVPALRARLPVRGDEGAAAGIG